MVPALDEQLRDAIARDDLPEILRLADQFDKSSGATKIKNGAAALWYADAGLYVFPLQAGTKIPLKGSAGCKDATRDGRQIVRWWTDNPDRNIGIATGRVCDVVDIDGLPGRESEAANPEYFDSLDVWGRVNTPRPGGTHLYVPAQGVGNKAGMLPGIDYRGLGGYVVAPPSVTDIGAYTWTLPLDIPNAARHE